MIPQDDEEFRDYLFELLSNDADLSQAVHHKSDVNVNDAFSQHWTREDLVKLIHEVTGL